MMNVNIDREFKVSFKNYDRWEGIIKLNAKMSRKLIDVKIFQKCNVFYVKIIL